MFAYLAAAPGTPRLRTKLASLFWADREDQQARGSLRQTLFRVRRIFSGVVPEVVEADALAVSVNADAVSCDAARVLDGEDIAAFDLKGGILEGWDGQSLEFDLWLASLRQSVRDTVHRFLVSEATQAERSGDFSKMIAAARRMAAADPYDEEAVRQLMTGLALSGNPAAAKDALRNLGALLRDELQTQPAQETIELGRQIADRQGRFGLSASAAPAPQSVTSALRRDAVRERRQITILVAWVTPDDFGKMGPEDILKVRKEVQEPFGAVLARFGGTIDRAPGLICNGWFGWPIVTEDAAERAVRAAIALRKLARCRFGIATTDMLIEPEFDPVGKGPDMAMELAASAQADSISICPTTAALITSRFEIENFSDAGAAPVITVNGERSLSGRFAARFSQGALETVGRLGELEILRDRMKRAEDGEAQTVIITGEAGIGKSHLQERMAEFAGDLDARRVLLQCLPTERDTPFAPLIDHFTIAAGLSGAVDPERRQRKLHAHLEEAGVSSPDQMAVIETMMGFPDAEDEESELPPVLQRRALISALTSYFLGSRGAWLVYVALEDAQYADPSTLELLSSLIDMAPKARICILVTARPEFDLSCLPDRNRTSLSLSALSRGESAQLVRKSSDGKFLSETAAERIAEQADGIPLFIEELTRWYEQQQRSNEANEQVKTVPTGLRAVLEARLNALGHFRRVVQRAACIGRQFDRDALLAACADDSSDMDAAIQAMIESRLIFRFAGPSGEDFVFRHAMLSEAAYESLPEDARQRTHRRLHRYFAQGRQSSPEVAAHHAARADLNAEALRIYKKCGSDALAKFAHKEARAHFENALAQITHLPLTEASEDERLDVMGRLSLCYAHAFGYAHRDTERLLNEARRLALSRPQSPHTIPILWQTFSMHYTHAEGEQARDVGAALLSLSHWDAAYGPQEAVGNRFIAAGQLLQGQFVEADRHFTEAREALETPGASNSRHAMGLDQLIPTGMLHARVLTVLNRMEEAVALIDKTLKIADGFPQIQPQITARVLAGQTLLIQENWERAATMGQEALDTSGKRESYMWLAYSQCILGIAHLRLGDVSAKEIYIQGQMSLRESETQASTTLLDAMFAAALAESDHIELSKEQFADLESRIEKGIEPWTHPEVFRLDVVSNEKTGRLGSEQAVATVDRALNLARRQNARLWQVRLEALA